MATRNTSVRNDINNTNDLTMHNNNLTTSRRSIWLLIIGVLLILCGIYVILNPITALLASAMFIGLVFIVLGAGYLMVFRERNSYWMLALGILDLIIGVLFLGNLGITAASMPVIFGLWILFNGITEIVMGLEMKRNSDPNWQILFWGGIGGIIFSLLIFAYPVVGTFMITALIGIYLIVYGMLEIIRYFKCC